MMAEIIPVNATLKLRAADESHVPALHQLVLKNKAWLQQSLDWPQYVTSQTKRVNMSRVICCCTSVATPKCI
ncbi:ribosomal-protein-L7/L12-serine acetyltransferase [Salmonella enterica subsp. arizonae]|nr:ribosomal-protein-L7/L12-serine acetyltransferase [Salmonella enterica subsp. arizonae]